MEDFRVKVDHRFLTLQNLLYEKAYLLREIEACNHFIERPHDINICSVEEFKSSAPSNLKLYSSAHQLMTNRLIFERQQRVSLMEALQQKKAERVVLKEQTEEKLKNYYLLEEKLSGLVKHCIEIKSLLHSLDPSDAVYESFGEEALHLPDPLYAFYCLVESFRLSFDKSVYCEIVGDKESAKVFNENEARDKPPPFCEEDSTDFKRGGLSKVARKGWFLEGHPLSLRLHFTLQNTTFVVSLKYAVHLKLICVQALSEQQKLSSETARVLCYLYPSDSGVHLPSDKMQYLLDSAGITSVSEVVVSLGYPFMWAQTACGLLQNSAEERWQRQYFSQLILLIKRRLNATWCLSNELNSLKKGRIEQVFASSDSVSKRSLSTAGASLSSWSFMDEAEGIKTYSFIISKTKDTLSLRGTVRIPPNYPTAAPEFSVYFHPFLENDSYAHAVEQEVNVHYEELLGDSATRDYLLSRQLKRLEELCDYYIQLHAIGSAGGVFWGAPCGGRPHRGPLLEPPSKIDVEVKTIVHRNSL
ncbi:THO complex subunit 5 homolog [Zophobas morio]|uniref:THO complex subunit 5 homolog n=1 Tax=Zophobas morio TaxID=2755281 RepID=UPI003082BFE2